MDRSGIIGILLVLVINSGVYAQCINETRVVHSKYRVDDYMLRVHKYEFEYGDTCYVVYIDELKRGDRMNRFTENWILERYYFVTKKDIHKGNTNSIKYYRLEMHEWENRVKIVIPYTIKKYDPNAEETITHNYFFTFDFILNNSISESEMIKVIEYGYRSFINKIYNESNPYK